MHGQAPFPISSHSQSLQILDPFMKKASPTTPPASSAYTGTEKNFRFNANALPFVSQADGGQRSETDGGGGRGLEVKAAGMVQAWTLPVAAHLEQFQEAANTERADIELLEPPAATVRVAESSPMLQLRGIAHSVALNALSSPQVKAAPAPTLVSHKLPLPPMIPNYWLDDQAATGCLRMPDGLTGQQI